MKLFTKRLVVFLLFPLLFTILFDTWLRNENSTYKAKYSGLIAAKDSVQVLILGASQAAHGVDPSQFKEFYAYNLANGSQQNYFNKRLTIKAIENGVTNLEYVFISINNISLFISTQGVRDKWSYYGNGIKYKDESYSLTDISPFLWGYTPVFSLAMAKNRIQKIINNDQNNFYLEEDKTYKINKGFLYIPPNANSNTKIDTSGFNIRAYQNRMKRYKERENSERKSVVFDLEDFIVYLKSNNITPILFTPPTYTEFNKYYDKAQLTRNTLDIEKLCNKYNIEHWDYMHDSRFIIGDYGNGDHLNLTGSQKLGKILSDRLSDYVRAQR